MPQIFLNETCKDAIPFIEFINNLKLTVEDLDNTYYYYYYYYYHNNSKV